MSTHEDGPAGTNLDNLVPYTHPSAGWSDRHSNIVLTWERPEEPGLQRLEALQGWAGTILTHHLLGWQIYEDETALPLSLEGRNYRPDRVTETDAAPELGLTVTVAFPAHNTLAVELELTNLSDRPRRLEVRFTYPGQGAQPDWSGPYPLGPYRPFQITEPGHCVSIDGEPEGSWSTLYIHLEHGRNIKWVEGYVAGMPEGAALEMVCLANLAPRTVELAPRGRSSFAVAMGFGRNRGAARRALHAASERLDTGWAPAAETARLRQRLAEAQPLPGKYAAQERYERMYAHAIAGLDSLFIQGEGGYTGDKRIPWTTKDLLAIAFFWDSCWSCVGAREFDPAMAQEAIECFSENATPRGSLPGTMCDTHKAGEGQAPIMAWASWLTYKRSRDRAWLGRVYPALAACNRFWFRYHASARGLAQWFNAGQIGDNDARFDRVYGREQGNEPIYGFDSPDLNAFLVVELRCLAAMAGELGRPQEAESWQEHAAQLGQLIVDTMYFPEHAMFFDVKEGTREIYSGVKTPNLFLPLWAGVPLPEGEVRRVIEGHMLNPDEFFRELPFPSLSYDNPKYDPRGYWRGRIWPHFGFWMVQTLWQHGYHAEADLTADRFLRMYQRTPWFHENYESSGGSGWDGAKQMGFPDYNWAHATVIELLLERYKEPIV
jgi:hypothetical protein